MRSLSDINVNIQQLKTELKRLHEEKKLFQSCCPHPEEFVTREDADYDNEWGVYEVSYVSYTCALCEGNWTQSYNENHEATPTLEEVIEWKT